MVGTKSLRASSASPQASIRSVLQARGAKPFTFWASAISDAPSGKLEGVVDEPGAVHGLNGGPDGLTIPRRGRNESA